MYTESIDSIRRYKGIEPLPLDEDGELHQNEIIKEEREGFTDPADIFEQEENLLERAIQAAQAIKLLPPRQQFALLCKLRENLDAIPPIIVEIFIHHGLDIQQATWSDDKQEAQRLHASLAIARKKLQRLKFDPER